MLRSGLDIGVVVAGSALLLISLIIFFYALSTYRASKANVTPPERASTHLEVSTYSCAQGNCRVRLVWRQTAWGEAEGSWALGVGVIYGLLWWKSPVESSSTCSRAQSRYCCASRGCCPNFTCVVTVCQTRNALGFLRDIGSTAGVSVALVGLLPPCTYL